jgi:hypothetical protein
MDAVLYVSHGGTLVLVPDCFEPSSDLVHVHGRFRRCGRVHIVERSATGLCLRICADFDERSYSILDSRDAAALLGPEMPRPFGDRRWQPRDVPMVCGRQHSGTSASPVPGQMRPAHGGKWSPATALRAIRTIASRGGTSMRDFVRFARMAAPLSAALDLRPRTFPRDAADCTTSREL